MLLEDVNVSQIGTVRNDIKDPNEMPPLGVKSRIEVYPEYAAGLLWLEKHSHVWVFAWLHYASRNNTQVVPRALKHKGLDALHGVFAVRTTNRPNPIGITVAKIAGTHVSRVECDRLDFVDGTPVIDLKPYFVTHDLVYSASTEEIGRPESREMIRESLLLQGERFCGEITPEVEKAADCLAHFRATVLEFQDTWQWRISIPKNRLALADAVMAMTRVRLGNGGLRFHARNSLLIESGGSAREYPI